MRALTHSLDMTVSSPHASSICFRGSVNIPLGKYPDALKVCVMSDQVMIP